MSNRRTARIDAAIAAAREQLKELTNWDLPTPFFLDRGMRALSNAALWDLRQKGDIDADAMLRSRMQDELTTKASNGKVELSNR